MNRALWSSGGALVVIAAGAVASLGCSNQQQRLQRELTEAQQVSQAKDLQIAALQWRSLALAREVQIHQQQLQQTQHVQLVARQLEELLRSNQALSTQLRESQESLARLRELDDDGTVAENESPFEAKTHHGQLEELTDAHLQSDERQALYRELLRTVQFLVNSGQVRMVQDDDGRARFVMPPPLETESPWGYR